MSLPTLEEQARIVELLSAWETRADAALANAEALVAKAKELRLAYLQQAFGPMGPIRERVLRNPSLKGLVRVTHKGRGDFYVQRSGGEHRVGRPFRDYLPHHFAVTVLRRDLILPAWLYYVAEYAWAMGLYKPLAHGTLMLQHVTVRQVEKVLGVMLEGRVIASNPVVAFRDVHGARHGPFHVDGYGLEIRPTHRGRTIGVRRDYDPEYLSPGYLGTRFELPVWNVYERGWSANPGKVVPGFEKLGEGFQYHPVASKKTRALLGLVLYRGPSPLGGVVIRDTFGRMGRVVGGNVVLIATLNSGNRKTGPMIQTWILLDDMHPSDAIKTGADAAICGFCPHRERRTPEGSKAGARTCYVSMRYVGAIWKAYKRGIYRELAPDQLETAFRMLGLAGYELRIGSYGDPAAVPSWVWSSVLGIGSPDGLTLPVNPTCYTHQWAHPVAAPLRPFCMASVDTPTQQAQATRMGWRTFRVGLEALPGEVLCPASSQFFAKTGKRVTCAGCRLCCGQQRPGAKSVFIPPHGAAAVTARRRLKLYGQNPQDETLRRLMRAALADRETLHPWRELTHYAHRRGIRLIVQGTLTDSWFRFDEAFERQFLNERWIDLVSNSYDLEPVMPTWRVARLGVEGEGVLA